MGLKTICKPQDTNELQGSGELPWRPDTYKSADCIKRTHVNMQMENYQGLEESSYVSISSRSIIDGLFA